MNKITSSKKIYIGTSKICPVERGVFALEPIKEGELIERCPVIAISADDTENITEESLVTYMYYFGKKKEQSLIALGFGSLYNHTNQPNTAYEIKLEENIIEFTAVKDIQKDEEITVNYGQNNGEEKRPLWFIKP